MSVHIHTHDTKGGVSGQLRLPLGIREEEVYQIHSADQLLLLVLVSLSGRILQFCNSRLNW